MEINEKRKRNKESVKAYQQGRDAIMLRPSKDEGQVIRTAADAAGQSVQAYVLQAIRERMERDAAYSFGISGEDRQPE